MRIVMQGKKVFDEFENESVQEIMELHLRAQENAKETIFAAATMLGTICEKGTPEKKERLKVIDKLAKSIRDNIKFLNAKYTLVDGIETYPIGGGRNENRN